MVFFLKNCTSLEYLTCWFCTNWQDSSFFFLNNLYLFLFFWLPLGLCCCVRTFSRCSEPGLLFMAEHRLLIAGHRLRSGAAPASRTKAQYCGAWAELLLSTWDPPGPGTEPPSPATAGGFLLTRPLGSPGLFTNQLVYNKTYYLIYHVGLNSLAQGKDGLQWNQSLITYHLCYLGNIP